VTQVLTIPPGDWTCPSSLLRKPSQPVDQIDGEVRLVLEKLRSALRRIPYGTGLSAIQLGVPLQLAIVNLDRSPSKEIVLINPVVLRLSGRATERIEGCLSMPDYKGKVKRRDKLLLETTSLDGQRIELASRGYESAVVQHELDHMAGLFYWDRMESGRCPDPLAPTHEGEHTEHEH